MCDRHFSKNCLNIKSFYPHNDPVKSGLLLVADRLTKGRCRDLKLLAQKYSDKNWQSQVPKSITLDCLVPLWSQSHCTPSRFAPVSPAFVSC